MIDSMVTELGLKEGEQWSSDTHKAVAERVCLCNSSISTRDRLIRAVSWINKQDEEFLKNATLGNLVDAGAPII